jgi:hypothetical protein
MALCGRIYVWMVSILAALLSAGCLLSAGPLPAQAAGTETRDFTVKIDGRQAGQYHLNIQHKGDGSVVVTAQAKVKLSYLIYSYKYFYQGTEVWKDGRLWQLDSTANDDGKKYQVTAAATENRLRVTSNGKEHLTRWDVWTTTYWHAPEAKFRNQVVPLLDVDTGRDVNSKLELLDTQQLVVAGQVQNCPHYRLNGGGLNVEVWYDAQGRLVRQEGVEDGHKTLFELVGIRR